MNVFNIIGPVMIGPSSSHTAGACRLGRVVNKVIGDHQIKELTIQLSGSFARTFQGHGTDRALLAGIMGYHSWSEEIRDAMKIATERGIHYTFVPQDISGAHPNTARVTYVLDNGTTGMVEGASIGGGNIRVDRIDGMEVNFTGDSNTLLVLHKDTPGVIANVTNLMYWRYGDLNIGNFRLSRKEKGGQALMTIEIDQLPPAQLIDDLKKMENIDNAIMIRAI
jgi:L-serine dehydratase